VHPASRAGVSLVAISTWGTFQATMAPTTPTGSRRTMKSRYRPGRCSSHWMARARSIIEAMMSSGAPTWPSREKLSGEPFSELMVRAISSARAAKTSTTRRTAATRSATGSRGQSDWSKACRADPTAASTSGAVAAGTRPMTSSVWASTTSMTSVEEGSSQRPPMKSRGYFRTSRPPVAPIRG
jgi:hypothetical protein